MLRIAILLLIFGSVVFLAYKFIPLIISIYSRAQKKRMEKMTKQLDQMFIFTEKRQLFPIFAVTPLTLGLIGLILMRNPIAIVAGAALGLVIPSIVIKLLTLRRRSTFQAQLVDGLMLLSSSLRAGMSLSQAFEVLVEEMTPPISEEFALVVRANQMGVTMDECLAHLKKRMPMDDLDLITTAISISRETGGDLTEIIGQLVYTMREKYKLENRVRALTVQGRLQGAIMGVLPVAFGIFIYFVNPGNFQILLTDRIGQLLLMWAVISELIGIILIKTLSRIEV